MGFQMIVHLRNGLAGNRSLCPIFWISRARTFHWIWKRMWNEAPLPLRGWNGGGGRGWRRGKEDSSNDALLLSVCIPRCTYIGIGHAWQDAWLATPVKTRKTRRIQTRLVPFAPFQDSLPPRLLFGSFFLLLFASPFLMKNVGRRRIYIEEECTVVMKSAISLIAAWRVWGMEDGDLWKEREREFDAIYWDNSKILNEFNLRKRHYSWKNNFENKENTMCMVIIIIFVRNKLKIK